MEHTRLGWPIFVGIVTKDLEGQRAFYRDVLGFSELERGDDWIWFDGGDGRLLELLGYDAERPQYARPGTHVGYQVEDIHAAAAEVRARGAEPVTEVLGGPEATQYWCYFRDADGNLFELVQKI